MLTAMRTNKLAFSKVFQSSEQHRLIFNLKVDATGISGIFFTYKFNNSFFGKRIT